MIDGRHETAGTLGLGNNNAGQLGNSFDHEDLGKAAGSGYRDPGNSSFALLQRDNPIKQQKGITVGQIMCWIRIKQKSLP